MTKKELIIFASAGVGITLILIFLRATGQIDTAQLITLIVTSIIVLVTVVYVKRTADIAQASKEQAEASTKMLKQRVKPRLIPDFYLEGIFSENREVPFNFIISNDGEGPAYDLDIRIEDDSNPPNQLKFYEKRPVLRSRDSIHWSRPNPKILFPKSDSIQRRFLVITYRDIDGEYEIRQPFVLEVVDEKPYARCESISRKLIRKIDLEDE